MEGSSTDRIRTIARAPALGVLVDFDGTLIPIAATPEQAHGNEEALTVLLELARAPSTRVVVISGRPRDALEARLDSFPNLWLVAEHGAWRRDDQGWHPLSIEGTPPHRIARILEAIAIRYPGALVERKTWSVCLHFRRVPHPRRDALLARAHKAMAAWIRTHAEYELLVANEALEVRHRSAHKGRAVPWLRAHLGPGARLIAFGDDTTDEDTFAAMGPTDLSIRVGLSERPTQAEARLSSPSEVLALLRWLARVRVLEAEAPPSIVLCPPVSKGAENPASLLVISNRLPITDAPFVNERARNVGGLVAALESALAARDGLWLGWSGQACGGGALAIDRSERPARACFDFEPRWRDLFYNGFSNRSLWPLFHGMPGQARYLDEEWDAYVEVNDAFADAAARVAAKDATIWVHDYHLLLVGIALRRREIGRKLGFFLHIPFPPLDLFETIPWAPELLDGLLAFDLLGFHTRRYASNFIACACAMGGAIPMTGGVRIGHRIVRAAHFPLGIDPRPFEEPGAPEHHAEISELEAALHGRKLVLGVDRLDYTKGIPERLKAFARMLEMFPSLRTRVSMVQVAVPSRADVPEYAEQRRAIETLVGHIHGEYGETDWVPVHYLYRSYERGHLARLYRAAHVGFVTPLRDGMNLVAKEYVAAQEPDDPGVLLLSRFAGAAEGMPDALLTNPYHIDGMARDLARALSMPHEERVRRHTNLLEGVHATMSVDWAESFLSALEA